MAIWSSLGLQEGITVIIQLMIQFHDYMIILLCVIIVFVRYIFVLILSSTLVDKYIIESHFLELIWTLIPIVFLFFMAYPSLYLLYITEDLFLPRITLKVIAHQWYWEYEYTTSSLSYSFDSYMLSSLGNESFVNYRCLDVDNRVSLPISLSTLLLVTSADVLHSWTVPSLGVKADAVPGRLNFLTVVPMFSGVYYGQCSELCGRNHSFMPIVLEVISLRDYLKYLFSLNS